ncbi:MAG: hypothetical protein ABI416_16660 [Ginsengibacter sp.]
MIAVLIAPNEEMVVLKALDLFETFSLRQKRGNILYSAILLNVSKPLNKSTCRAKPLLIDISFYE